MRYIRNELQALIQEWRDEGIDIREISDAVEDAARDFGEELIARAERELHAE